MKTIKIAIDFTKPSIRNFHSDEYIEDVRKAIHIASLNLLFRHKIELSELKVTSNGLWYVEMSVPDDVSIDNFGRHLRGVSKYLLNCWPEKYDPLRTGTRLLYYEILCEN